jgi:transposase
LHVKKEAKPNNATLQSYYQRSWEHLRLFQYRCFIHCRLPVYKDNGELHKADVGFSRDYSRFTLLYEKEVMRLMKIHHCFKTVAEQLGIYPQRVESIYHYTADYQTDLIEQTPVKVGCDETSTRKGHNYMTTFYDLETGKIIGIYDGKSAQCVEQFMKDHPYPQALRHLSIDMSTAFISGAKSYFAQADITFDKWHVIKLLYKHLDSLENKTQFVAFKKYIQLLMNELQSFYQQKEYEHFTAQLTFIADFAQEQFNENPITKTIKSYFTGIANYAKSNLTNGVLEGINSKIQAIKRVARGFRYVENFKKLIRFVFSDFNYQVIS